jgi:hypothetical protein
MLKSIKYSISILILGILSSGCQSDYTKLVKEELAKGVRYDSVLLGINLGDTRNDFYGRCFDLNKSHLVTDGGGGFVKYMLIDSIFHKDPVGIEVLFHANFDNKDKLAEMLLELTYAGWSPANPAYSADSLKVNTMKLLKHWYGGNDFIIAKVNDKDMTVKLDGNRRILIYKKDEQNVEVKIQDILHPIFRHSISSDSEKEKR